MRVSERMRYNLVQNRVETAKKNNAEVLDTLSSQKRINRLSDDPVSAAAAIRHQVGLKDLKQYEKNMDYSLGYIGAAEKAINRIYDKLIRAKELSVAMANGTMDAASRKSTAREIREIISEVVELGNTQFNQRYVFSGFRTKTPALSQNGTFLGDNGAIFLPVGKDTFRQINLQSRFLFDANQQERERGHFNLVDTLTSLLIGMNADDDETIVKVVGELDFQMEKVTSYQAALGAIYNAINDQKKALEFEHESLATNLSGLEDVDIYQATSDFRRTEAVLQSTLLASTKLLQPSLLNFLQ